MLTTIEEMRTNMTTLDQLAIAYANALVAYWQTDGDEQKEALNDMTALHEKLSTIAKTIAQTIWPTPR